ncbi:MAG: cobalamin-dependent protein [Planctomycetota bacterium]|nr:MAG: cobalamin-dependent protein [Planctomycetota bacterium]
MTAIFTPSMADTYTPPIHPKGSQARVLLTSVFGPYAQDDEYGSRTINPMELYHNQVTRVQGPFSLRMFHRSWGLMLIQANIGAPCTLLDFPKLDRFIHEITTNHYDVVGISSIMPNLGKAQKMCELIRQHLPEATIVVGGHVAGIPDLNQRIDADHIVKGEGIRWMRRFLAEDEDAPIRHPRILSGIGTRNMGITLRYRTGDVAATLIPSVGCPMGCNFCSTSAMFGGKGKCIHFYETGDELFEVMCQLEKEMQVNSFFIMDENFLLHRKRALRLLALMIENNKPWALYVFSSANVLRSYTIEQLVALGISWVWMGLEGKDSQYAKLHGIDTHQLVRTLQSHGIRVLGSTIIGLEEHTPANIDAAIEHAVSHNTEFHQFMLYTPAPGTPMYDEHLIMGTLLDSSEISEADIHGQYRFNYRHPHIKPGQETEFLLRAFDRDFEVNGPSIIRVMQTTLKGWQRYKNHPDSRIRTRFEYEIRELATTHAGAIWATIRWFRNHPLLSAKFSTLLKDVYREFGLKSRLAAPVVGRYIYSMLKREERRLSRGWTYEPPTFYQTRQMITANT